MLGFDKPKLNPPTVGGFFLKALAINMAISGAIDSPIKIANLRIS